MDNIAVITGPMEQKLAQCSVPSLSEQMELSNYYMLPVIIHSNFLSAAYSLSIYLFG